MHDLIAMEEKEYLSEMEDRHETAQDRQAKLRERANSLKEKGEKERLAMVEQKLDQRWR